MVTGQEVTCSEHLGDSQMTKGDPTPLMASCMVVNTIRSVQLLLMNNCSNYGMGGY